MNESTPVSAHLPSDSAAKMAQIKDLVEELWAGAPAAAKEAAVNAKEMATRAGRTAVDTVRKHPFEAVAVAVGTGLLVWWLMSRRKESV